MSRMIVVEGADGAGKSSLVAKLGRDLNRETIHAGGPPKDEKEWAERCAKFYGMSNQPVILDRIPFISEQIYGPLYGRSSQYRFEELTRDLVFINPVIVYCRLATPEEMFQRIDLGMKDHKPSAHMQLVLDNHYRIVNDYDNAMRRFKFVNSLDVIRYNWFTEPYAYLLKELDRCAA